MWEHGTEDTGAGLSGKWGKDGKKRVTNMWTRQGKVTWNIPKTHFITLVIICPIIGAILTRHHAQGRLGSKDTSFPHCRENMINLDWLFSKKKPPKQNIAILTGVETN